MKKGIVLSAVLIIGLIILIYLSNLSGTGISFLTYSQKTVIDDFSQMQGITEVSQEQLSSGASFNLKKNDILGLNPDGDRYPLKITDIDYFTKRISFALRDERYYILLSEEKKVDLDNDNNYDLLIRIESVSSEGAKIYISKINESVNAGDYFDNSIEKSLKKLEDDYKNKLNVSLLVFAFFLFLLTLYMIIAYLIPYIKYNRIMARERPSDALEYLLMEFERAYRNRDMEKASSISGRISHMYEHLSETQKNLFKGRVSKVARLTE